MHVPIPARLRSRRALPVAALLLAAMALPSAAEAASVGTGVSGQAFVVDRSVLSGNPAETNRVTVAVTGSFLVVTDAAGITTEHQGSDGRCFRVSAVEASCPLNGITSVAVNMGFGDDTVEYAAPHRASILGGDGHDTFVGGRRQAVSGRSPEPTFYFGGTGLDAMDYALADRGVRVDTADGVAGDGRPGFDFENVDDDIERIFGSDFADVLFGSSANDQFTGRKGDDQIAGGLGNDTFIEHDVANGADSLDGGPGQDRVSYAERTRGVNVSLDGVRDDGEPGERDDVRGNVENVNGGGGADTLIGDGVANDLVGFGGADNIEGRGGNDILTGGASNNRLAGGTGNDVINARNGELDNVECGDNTDIDTANRDSAENRVVGCERGTVGVLRVAPAAARAEAGDVVRMRLSWRHPEGWSKLRTLELRLLSQDGVPVGTVTVRPSAQRITADGAVRLVGKAGQLTRAGRTVTARLAVRLDDSLAGQSLKTEVEATDTRGRRQLERNAGTVRVAG